MNSVCEKWKKFFVVQLKWRKKKNQWKLKMKTKVFGLLATLFAIFKYIGCQSMTDHPPSLFCTDLKPQNNVDIEQVCVKWIWILIRKKKNKDKTICLRLFVYLFVLLTDPRYVVWKWNNNASWCSAWWICIWCMRYYPFSGYNSWSKFVINLFIHLKPIQVNRAICAMSKFFP